MEDKTNKENYEIVKGNGELEISPVYSHVKINKNSKSPNKKNIIIPSEKK